MPGQVLHLNLSVGQLIEKGQDVITLEAMKMENTIQAPHEGVIKEIFVNEGETVAKGQRLIEID
jgi:biotin carboxyl carrier protein